MEEISAYIDQTLFQAIKACADLHVLYHSLVILSPIPACPASLSGPAGSVGSVRTGPGPSGLPRPPHRSLSLWAATAAAPILIPPGSYGRRTDPCPSGLPRPPHRSLSLRAATATALILIPPDCYGSRVQIPAVLIPDHPALLQRDHPFPHALHDLMAVGHHQHGGPPLADLLQKLHDLHRVEAV